MTPPHRFDPPIIGSSPAAQRLRDLILNLAGSDVSVLITGDSGVGKEVLARNLHRFSPRAQAAFVSVNCAALAPGILESELFGHDRGAFTGAVRSHAGLFEQANNGTLFLDEIGEIPPYIQAKLLRVLQEGEVRRMGEGGVRRVDVRVITATNANLAQMVAAGTFRKDLFYRINVVEARIPALRERRGDVIDLVAHFFEQRGGTPPAIPEETARILCGYAWPGNVRELENEVERIAVLHPGARALTPDMLSDRITTGAVGAALDVAVLCESPLAHAVSHLEENLLRKTLAQTNWNKSQTARRLGLSRQGLLKKIKRYGLERGGPAPLPGENSP
jgi:two-component system NtrC family response regulator